jgi:hypothetical protein
VGPEQVGQRAVDFEIRGPFLLFLPQVVVEGSGRGDRTLPSGTLTPSGGSTRLATTEMDPITPSCWTQARVSAVSTAGSSSSRLTMVRLVRSGSVRMSSIHSTWSRMRPVATSSRTVRAARR